MTTIELTSTEAHTLTAALEVYRRVKSAERMLRGQKDATEYPRYDALLAVVAGLQTRLAGS